MSAFILLLLYIYILIFCIWFMKKRYGQVDLFNPIFITMAFLLSELPYIFMISFNHDYINLQVRNSISNINIAIFEYTILKLLSVLFLLLGFLLPISRKFLNRLPQLSVGNV